AGDLYALPSSGGRSARFPAWQFEGSQVVPGLREIVPAFPGHFHPLSIQGFMTTPHDELGARSPAQWLLRGGPVSAVVALVEELGYERAGSRRRILAARPSPSPCPPRPSSCTTGPCGGSIRWPGSIPWRGTSCVGTVRCAPTDGIRNRARSPSAPPQVS